MKTKKIYAVNFDSNSASSTTPVWVEATSKAMAVYEATRNNNFAWIDKVRVRVVPETCRVYNQIKAAAIKGWN